uniref:YitT family protein n=1 Tax=Parolsenella massiliensis TaxID=1871022 RepID=UPI0009FADD3C|nr:YitT family protein [Parolsenella massiliensis]
MPRQRSKERRTIRTRQRRGELRAVSEETLRDAEVTPHEAEPAYEGASLIQAEKLLSPEEYERSESVIDRRDNTGALKTAVMLNLAVMMAALSYVLFTAPNHLALGGASGLSIVVAGLVPGLPNTVALWAINLICIVVGLALVGRKTVAWSVAASLALSTYVSAFSKLMPVSQSITGDLWIDLMCAVVLTATSAAMAYSVGASTGGTDIIIVALSKLTSLTTGNATLIVNSFSVVGSLLLFDVRTGIYCVIGLLVMTVVVNGVLDGLKQHKVVTVICKQPARAEEFICRELCRTATVSQAWGAYSGNAVTQIMTVLTPKETLRLELFVRELDSSAFITYVNTSQITGRGFRWV